MKLTGIISSVAIASLFASCTSSHVAGRLPGTWKIVTYKEQSANLSESTASNVGTLSFTKKGKGEKRMSYRILQNNVSDSTTFTWVGTDENVRISEGSNAPKTWIVEKNEKSRQVWKSTDGAGNMQQMELKKQ